MSVQLPPARSPLLEARSELVHQTLGIAQLGRAHPVEWLVAEARELAPGLGTLGLEVARIAFVPIAPVGVAADRRRAGLG